MKKEKIAFEEKKESIADALKRIAEKNPLKSRSVQKKSRSLLSSSILKGQRGRELS